MVLIAGCLGLRVSEIVALQWRDFDFPGRTLLIQRSVIHGKVGEVKTEYSRDSVPLDASSGRGCDAPQGTVLLDPGGWLFANPVTGKPHPPGGDPKEAHSQGCCRLENRRRYRLAHIPPHLSVLAGWNGAPLTVQKELMRHASIQTTMNIYGKAMTDSKRQAHSKVVEMVLNSRKNDQTFDHKKPVAAIGS
jgi:integrase